MALDFPANPVDGQVYPDPAIPGAQQYIYNADKGTWLTVFKGIEKLSARTPLFLTGSESSPTVNISPASQTAGGYMTAADKTKLDSLQPTAGTVTEIKAGAGLGAPLPGDVITSTGTLQLVPPNLVGELGGVKAGNGVSISTDGSVNLKPPTQLFLGGVKQGEGINIASDGAISVGVGATYTMLDSLAPSFNGSRTSFQLTVGQVPYTPGSVKGLLIFIGGVAQTPLEAFSLSGSTVTFTSAPPTNASFFGLSLT